MLKMGNTSVSQIESEIKSYFSSIPVGAKFTHSISKQYDTITKMSRSMGNNDANLASNIIDQQNIFLNSIEYLDNPQVFWGLCGYVWTYIGTSDSRWRDAWIDKNRMNLHIKDRINLFEFAFPSSAECAQNLFSTIRMEDTFKVYRYFKARPGNKIRKGETKIDEGWFIQSEGAGYSYTTAKSIACALSGNWLNREIIRRKSNASDIEVDAIRRKHHSIGEDSIWDGRDRYWVATYEAKKKDVIGTCIVTRFEQEIILMNSKLIRYEIISGIDSLTAVTIRGWRKSLWNMNGIYLFLDSADKEIFKLVRDNVKKIVRRKDFSWMDFYLGGETKMKFEREMMQKISESIIVSPSSSSMIRRARLK